MKKIFISILYLTCFTLLNGQYNGKIIKVYDGETFWVELDNGDIDSVRLYGIDSPELEQQYGIAAKSHLVGHLHREVELEYKTRDKNNFMMAYVFYDTKNEKHINLNHEMLEKGYAWKARFNKDKDLEKLEKKARQKRVGLWKNSKPVEPWVWRKNQKR